MEMILRIRVKTKTIFVSIEEKGSNHEADG